MYLTYLLFCHLLCKSANSSKDDDIMPSVIFTFNIRLVYTEYFPGGIRSFVSGKLSKTTCVTASSLTRVSESHYKTSNQKSGCKIFPRKRCTASVHPKVCATMTVRLISLLKNHLIFVIFVRHTGVCGR